MERVGGEARPEAGIDTRYRHRRRCEGAEQASGSGTGEDDQRAVTRLGANNRVLAWERTKDAARKSTDHCRTGWPIDDANLRPQRRPRFAAGARVERALEDTGHRGAEQDVAAGSGSSTASQLEAPGTMRKPPAGTKGDADTSEPMPSGWGPWQEKRAETSVSRNRIKPLYAVDCGTHS